MSDIPTAKQIKYQAVYAALMELLTQCTEKQVEFFHKMNDSAPWKGYKNIPVDHLDDQYDLVRRTVIGNQNQEMPNV